VKTNPASNDSRRPLKSSLSEEPARRSRSVFKRPPSVSSNSLLSDHLFVFDSEFSSSNVNSSHSSSVDSRRNSRICSTHRSTSASSRAPLIPRKILVMVAVLGPRSPLIPSHFNQRFPRRLDHRAISCSDRAPHINATHESRRTGCSPYLLPCG